jgi:hypothetical protein
MFNIISLVSLHHFRVIMVVVQSTPAMLSCHLHVATSIGTRYLTPVTGPSHHPNDAEKGDAKMTSNEEK